MLAQDPFPRFKLLRLIAISMPRKLFPGEADVHLLFFTYLALIKTSSCHIGRSS